MIECSKHAHGAHRSRPPAAPGTPPGPPQPTPSAALLSAEWGLGKASSNTVQETVRMRLSIACSQSTGCKLIRRAEL